MRKKQMKQTIEYTDEEILYELQNVIREFFGEKIESIIESKATEIIDDQLNKRLIPIIDKFLNGGKFENHYGWNNDWSEKKKVDDIVEKKVTKYLDERVYCYSNSSDKPSERYHASSGTDGYPSRLEAFLEYSIAKYIDKNISEKMEGIVREFVQERGDIKKVAKEQMQQLLREKFKLVD